MSDVPHPPPDKPQAQSTADRPFLVSAAPHLADSATTQRIMFEVVLAMLPMLIVAVWLYRLHAVLVPLVTIVGCLLTEAAANRIRGRSQASLTDGSAIVTALILAFSLPPKLPLYMAFIGAVVAVSVGKAVFGGLGQNLFNPAMVGRAFLMACFPVAMTTWAEPATLATIGVDAVTRATPLAAAKFGSDTVPPLFNLFLGTVGGTLGETSALAVLVGGLFLVARRTADWRQPVGMLASVTVIATIAHWLAPDKYAGPLVHLLSGALLFGAFFIATDYVGAPVTPRGRLIFGIGVGAVVMVIRLFGGYPEGVMFAILIMNALTPLIERWTIPTPFGGKATA